MEINKNYTLSKTDKGLDIFRYILQKYDPNVDLIFPEGTCSVPVKDPFRENRLIMISIAGPVAVYEDINDKRCRGDAFEFAEKHFQLSGILLLSKIADALDIHNDGPRASDDSEMQEFIAPKFSFFPRPINNTRPAGDVSLVDVFDLIRMFSYKSATDSLRSLKHKEDAKKFKASQFDYVTFSGRFTKRSNDDLITHSGLMVLDFDDVSDLEDLKGVLLDDPYLETELLFKSPSGNGLKWVISVDVSEVTHQEYFKAVTNYLQKTYKLSVDESGKDVSRACFLGHDSDVYINPKHKPGFAVGPAKAVFDPIYWLEANDDIGFSLNNEDQRFRTPGSVIADIEAHLEVLEAQQLDITRGYRDWLKVGFALASEVGEEGRTYFHRLSCFHPNYQYSACDEQYDRCLRSKGQGITIRTLFHMFHQAGIKPSRTKEAGDMGIEEMPSVPPPFSDTIFPQLPHFLKRVLDVAQTKEERDMLLLGAMTCISACLPQVFGVYDNNRVYPNIFSFIAAKASSGKGRLNNCRQLIMPIHAELCEQTKQMKRQYEQELEDYQNRKKRKEPTPEKPQPPVNKMLFIPANSSATGFFQLLNENEGRGIMFSTEGDTLAETFKTDYGNYSEGLRKVFHHEPIEYFRRADNEHVQIELPKFSLLLTGTPNQICNLIGSAENGLFSRFIYYKISSKQEFKRVFDNRGVIDDHFLMLGLDFYGLYKQLQNGPLIEVKPTARQTDIFHKRFAQYQNVFVGSKNDDFVANVRRMGLICFRLCMIFTALRILETGNVTGQVEIDDCDFQNAVSLVETLLVHASLVYDDLPQSRTTKFSNADRKVRFLENLPVNFNRQGYLEQAAMLGITNKTAEKYITEYVSNGLLIKNKHNDYLKCESRSSNED